MFCFLTLVCFSALHVSKVFTLKSEWIIILQNKRWKMFCCLVIWSEVLWAMEQKNPVQVRGAQTELKAKVTCQLQSPMWYLTNTWLGWYYHWRSGRGIHCPLWHHSGHFLNLYVLANTPWENRDVDCWNRWVSVSCLKFKSHVKLTKKKQYSCQRKYENYPERFPQLNMNTRIFRTNASLANPPSASSPLSPPPSPPSPAAWPLVPSAPVNLLSSGSSRNVL